LAKKTVKKKATTASKTRVASSAKKKTKSAVREKSASAKSKRRAARPAVAKTSTRSKRRVSKKTTVVATRKVAGRNGGSAPATALDPVQFSEKPKKKVKTYLTAKQLRHFKTLLEEKRAELCGDVQRLTSEALGTDAESGGDYSTMPIHMADRGSDNWEQDFTLGLIASEESLVRDIDEALARIKNKTYGMCVASENPISVARLEAKPWAHYCIEYARARDEGRLR